jgi:hypothetical protein
MMRAKPSLRRNDSVVALIALLISMFRSIIWFCNRLLFQGGIGLPRITFLLTHAKSGVVLRRGLLFYYFFAVFGCFCFPSPSVSDSAVQSNVRTCPLEHKVALLAFSRHFFVVHKL